MKINIRRSGPFVSVKVCDERTTIDLGSLDDNECRVLAGELLEVASELVRSINVDAADAIDEIIV